MINNLLELWNDYGSNVLAFMATTLLPILVLYIKGLIKEQNIQKKQELKYLEMLPSKGDIIDIIGKIDENNKNIMEEIENTKLKINEVGEILNIVVTNSDVSDDVKTNVELKVDEIKTAGSKNLISKLIEDNKKLQEQLEVIEKEKKPQINKPKDKNRVRV